MFNKVVFPAPDDPIIALSCPALKIPEIPFKIVFLLFDPVYYLA